MNDFLKALAKNQTLVWPEVKSYLDHLLDFPPYCRIPRQYTLLKNFHQKLTSDYSCRKGKYLRSALVTLTAQAMGIPAKKTLKVAAAMQLCQDWVLNHDDIEDDSFFRRGQPTLHRIYGKELAINAGDALQVLMWRVLADNLKLAGPKTGLKIINEFSQMLSRTVFGQTVELKWLKENKLDLTSKDIFFILEGKTCYYTISGPMRLGAILAGAKKSQLDLLYEFGLHLGRCFQIKDDLLDLTSDFSGLKKQMGNDVYEGKRTLILAHLLQKANQKDKKKLEMILGKTRDQKTKEEVIWVIKLMNKYGSIEYAQKTAVEFAQKAKDFFDKKLGFLAKNPARARLRLGIDFIVDRKY
ncbi:MAG: polyprenyl synthetase family protein [Candidatus Shapirobacteria bacterium]